MSKHLGFCSNLFLSNVNNDSKYFKIGQDAFVFTSLIVFILFLIISFIKERKNKKPMGFFTRITHRMMIITLLFIFLSHIVTYLPINSVTGSTLSNAFSSLLIIFQIFTIVLWMTERSRKIRKVLDRRKPLVKLFRIIIYGSIPSIVIMASIIIAHYGFKVDVFYSSVLLSQNIENSHYSVLFFWMGLNSLYLIGFIIVLILVNTKLSERWMKNNFFVIYVSILLSFCILEFLGILVLSLIKASKQHPLLKEYESGLCILTLRKILYHSLLCPIMYLFLLSKRMYIKKEDEYYSMDTKDRGYESYSSYGPFSVN